MAANAPDFINLLCLGDPKISRSPFGGQHRTTFIERDCYNSSDFAFTSILHHMSRREPGAYILLVTLNQNWSHYAAGATKRGYILRRAETGGNIHVLDLMDRARELILSQPTIGAPNDFCETIKKEAKDLIVSKLEAVAKLPTDTRPSGSEKTLVIMIDDLSALLTLGSTPTAIFRLVTALDAMMRIHSQHLTGRLNQLILQTNVFATTSHLDLPPDDRCNLLATNLADLCDLSLSVKPLETGHSTKVDGTIRIVDNRVPVTVADSAAGTKPALSLFGSSVAVEIGSKRSYFYKLADKRVLLTSNALSL